MSSFFLILFASVLARTVSWAFSYFGLSSFEQLIFHIKVPLEGTNKRFLFDWLILCLLYGLILSVPVYLILVVLLKITWVSLVWFGLCLIYAAGKVGLFTYIIHQFQRSDLYEKDYIFCDDTAVKPPKEKKNLIHIYLESMETTYALKKDGGNAQEEILPYLTSLTKANISFSHQEKIGGAKVLTGMGWTTGGMVASSAGVPLNFPFYHPFCKDSRAFMKGLVSLGDILEREGYSNTLMIGSDAVFGGRKFYYDQHGHYDIQDIKKVKDEGWLPKDYHVFWGYEDEKLFEFAKKKITLLAKEDRPFNFEMLTVDTHHPYGYQKEGEDHPFKEGISNSIYHTDCLLKDFMSWLEKQPFYKDTVVVIQGDHTSMAAQYIHHNYEKSFDRRIWNCFVHSVKQPLSTNHREFSTLDLFPTILSSMGFELPKGGLGLGRDLFGAEKTLLEKYGEKDLNLKIKRQSKLYKKKILGL
ncbi:LTA synthase family protein [uncultured Faecalicoccus sp.]|uniref:LTA synthase family protein n=1 Tax=uncultured Faecalicoccus sp. TaxID=1971760 RepID=UPI00260832B8|nr:LTA synthase family protein [uncultured Faecalicoccus sp.]